MKKYDLSPALSAKVERAFQLHPLTQDQQQRIDLINSKISQCARNLMTITPESDEQSRMLNKLQEAKFLAEESIRKNEA